MYHSHACPGTICTPCDYCTELVAVPDVVCALRAIPEGQLLLYPPLGLKQHEHALHHSVGCMRTTNELRAGYEIGPHATVLPMHRSEISRLRCLAMTVLTHQHLPEWMIMSHAL